MTKSWLPKITIQFWYNNKEWTKGVPCRNWKEYERYIKLKDKNPNTVRLINEDGSEYQECTPLTTAEKIEIVRASSPKPQSYRKPIQHRSGSSLLDYYRDDVNSD